MIVSSGGPRTILQNNIELIHSVEMCFEMSN